MITWPMLLLPGVTGITNRLWRGEGETTRISWYGFMVMLFIVVSAPPIDIRGASCWLLFLLGYGVPPWQAMFSIVTRRPPSRKDSWGFQWMQGVARWMTKYAPTPYFGTKETDEDFWYEFGKNYGLLRALFMLPGVIALFIHYGSINHQYDFGYCTALFLPYAYVFGNMVRDHFKLPEDKSVAFAEVTMGWLIGTYMLIVAGGL